MWELEALWSYFMFIYDFFPGIVTQVAFTGRGTYHEKQFTSSSSGGGGSGRGGRGRGGGNPKETREERKQRKFRYLYQVSCRPFLQNYFLLDELSCSTVIFLKLFFTTIT